MTQDEQLYTMLKSKGFKGKELEKEFQALKSQGITLDQIVKEFVKKADADTTSINDVNCDGGRCTAVKLTSN